jgi:carbonic anhydrase
MTVTDELLRNNDRYAESFSDLEEDVHQSIKRNQASPFIPHKESVRGFIYEVETGRLREVT